MAGKRPQCPKPRLSRSFTSCPPAFHGLPQQSWLGGVAEWSIASDSKSDEPQGSGGSNPFPSARIYFHQLEALRPRGSVDQVHRPRPWPPNGGRKVGARPCRARRPPSHLYQPPTADRHYLTQVGAAPRAALVAAHARRRPPELSLCFPRPSYFTNTSSRTRPSGFGKVMPMRRATVGATSTLCIRSMTTPFLMPRPLMIKIASNSGSELR